MTFGALEFNGVILYFHYLHCRYERVNLTNCFLSTINHYCNGDLINMVSVEAGTKV